LGSKVVFFALVPFYSFFLSTDELGQYDLILISITLLTPLITIQLSDGVYRFLLQEEKKKDKEKVISTGLISILIGYLLFVTICFFINKFINYNFFVEFVLLQFAFCLYFFFQQVTRGLGTNKWFAFMGLINSTLVISLSVIFLVVLDMRVRGILLALLVSQLIAVIFTLFFGKIGIFIKPFAFDKRLAKELVRYSWPLLPNSISWWLIDLGNRYIILFFLDENYNGIYAIAARYAGIIAIFNSIFILTWQDYAISETRNEEESQANSSKVFNQFMLFELSLIVLFTSAAKYIVEFTTNNEFHTASNYLPVLLLSAGFSSFCAYYGAFYLRHKQTLGVFTTTLAGGIVNIIISIILINNIGLYAVAVGSLVGFITTFILRINTFKLNINFKNLFLLLTIYLVVLFLQYFHKPVVTIPLILGSTLLFILLNKKLIFSFLPGKIK
jgi:O-antigen/teichoic acid export membrane protein